MLYNKFILIVVLLLLNNCTIIKRKYNKGWFVYNNKSLSSQNHSFNCSSRHNNNSEFKSKYLDNLINNNLCLSSNTYFIFDCMSVMPSSINLLKNKTIINSNQSIISNYNSPKDSVENSKINKLKKYNKKSKYFSYLNFFLFLFVLTDFYYNGPLYSLFSPYSLSGEFVLPLYIIFIHMPIYILSILYNYKTINKYFETYKKIKLVYYVRFFLTLLLNYLTVYFIYFSTSFYISNFLFYIILFTLFFLFLSIFILKKYVTFPKNSTP